jgi:hypothetical protein
LVVVQEDQYETNCTSQVIQSEIIVDQQSIVEELKQSEVLEEKPIEVEPKEEVKASPSAVIEEPKKLNDGGEKKPKKEEGSQL